jgi:glycine cleavage system H protein
MAKILEGLRYSESHEYVKIEGDYAVVGITDFAQEQLGNVVYVDVPEVGDEVTAGETFGAVESTKAASDLVCPVSGEVVEVNEALEDEPELVNKDAFGEGWIIKVKLANPEEVEQLLDAKGYEAVCH